MNSKQRTWTKHLLLAGILCNHVEGGWAQSLGAMDEVVPAKSAIVVTVPLSIEGEVGGISLMWSRDGETFYPAQVGFPRPWQLFSHVQSADDTTTILVPLIGGFAVSDPRFLFDAPGMYHLKWSLTIEGQDNTPIEVEQTLEVASPRLPDVQFLVRLSDPQMLRHLFGDDFFERQTHAVRERMLSPEGADERALKVIARLLEFTRAAEPGDVAGSRGTPEMALVWADTLWPLAQEFPESSYAPYAAYYAGCSYMLSAMLTNKQAAGEICAAGAAARSPHYDLARSCLNLASERADLYLKPRVAYMQVFLKGVNADWDGALRLTDELGPTVQADATFAQQLQEMRAGLQREKSKRAGQ